MFNKVTIGILVFLLVLTGTLGAYAFNLAEEVSQKLLPVFPSQAAEFDHF